jgi:hypothetical protein
LLLQPAGKADPIYTLFILTYYRTALRIQKAASAAAFNDGSSSPAPQGFRGHPFFTPPVAA